MGTGQRRRLLIRQYAVARSRETGLSGDRYAASAYALQQTLRLSNEAQLAGVEPLRIQRCPLQEQKVAGRGICRLPPRADQGALIVRFRTRVD